MTRWLFLTMVAGLTFGAVVGWTALASAETGTATYYTERSCKSEGTSGIFTASGERYDESKLTCALRRRDWGSRWKVTNLANGKSVVVRLNDFGPGRKATARGVVVDLSPAAFEAIGGVRGVTRRGVEYGEAWVTVAPYEPPKTKRDPPS